MIKGGMRRNLVPGIILKIGFPLLIGLVTLVSAEAGGLSGLDALVLAAVVTLGFVLILFMVDTELRMSAVDDRMSAGFTQISRSAEMSAQVERSALDTTLLTDFLQTVGQVDRRANPLLQRLAHREIERVASFMRNLPGGSEIAYDGEARDWLLGLTREAERSIDAISLSTVDAGMRGLDGGLWTSDLGIRYLELQREAIARKVGIRRIFVFEYGELAQDESFLKITQMQRSIGVGVRLLDRQLIPDWLQAMIFDFTLFDGSVSYEMTPATAFTAGLTRPAIVRTLLAPMPDRVRDLEDQFERLWEMADPERQIDE